MLKAVALTFKSVAYIYAALILQRNEDKVIPIIAAINRSENIKKLRLENLFVLLVKTFT